MALLVVAVSASLILAACVPFSVGSSSSEIGENTERVSGVSAERRCRNTVSMSWVPDGSTEYEAVYLEDREAEPGFSEGTYLGGSLVLTDEELAVKIRNE